MKKELHISKTVITRLTHYRRILEELMSNGVDAISSFSLADILGTTASQIRQDLSSFGTFGRTGYGYQVRMLYEQIGTVIGLDRDYKMVVIGAGHLGHAIANNPDLANAGFLVKAMFDINPRLIGLKINQIEVLDCDGLEEYLKLEDIDIGIIATDGDSAAGIADRLECAGVRGIWNFATSDLENILFVPVQNVHLCDSLHLLAYRINHQDDRVEECG